MPDPNNATCPHCQQRAPIVLRGIDAYCTVCEGKRIPFTAKALNLAGKGSRWGGLAARLFGWSFIVVGTAMALATALFGRWMVEASWGLLFGLVFALPSWFWGGLAVFGGRKLGEQGESAERETQVSAIRALAAHQGGSVQAADVARSLSIKEAEADALLTELAKKPSENVQLDLDDDGELRYLFGRGVSAIGPRGGRRRFEQAGGAQPPPGPPAKAAYSDDELLAAEREIDEALKADARARKP